MQAISLGQLPTLFAVAVLLLFLLLAGEDAGAGYPL